MHVPDGFIDATTSLATGAVAVAGVTLALRGARRELDDRTAPMAGLVATFVFAGQMMNFPVGAGTSGHLLGGTLAAVLAGPWTAVLAITVVLLVQALLMADGGITALGTNVTLMALVAVVVGWLVFRGVRAVLPRRTTSVAPAAAIGAFVSVPAAALAFTAIYAVGGTAPVALDTVLTAMLSWHLVIGLGEAAITGLVVGERRRRPARPRLRRPRSPGRPAARDPAGGERMSSRTFFLTGLVVALLIAGVGSYYASGHADGLEHVAEQVGFLDRAEDSAGGRRPVRRLLHRGAWRTSGSAAGLAGVAGSVLVLVVAFGLFRALRRRDASDEPAERPGLSMGAGHGHKLHYHGHSVVHRAPAHLKLVGLVAFMLVVVATPDRPVRRLRRLGGPAPDRRGGLARAPGLPGPADGGRGAVRGLRAAAAVHRDRAAHRAPRPDRVRSRDSWPRPAC